MGDSFLNVIFIIAVIVVFIVRTISAAKKKQQPPPKVEIPVHFEDDEEPAYFKNLAAETAPKTPVQKPFEQRIPGQDLLPHIKAMEQQLSSQKQNVKKTAAPKDKAKQTEAAPLAKQQQSFPQNLSNLSPLKQAVVMAEILGPPKGLQ